MTTADAGKSVTNLQSSICNLQWESPSSSSASLIAAVGLVMMSGFPLGRLPGDYTIRRGAFTFYFPLASSILVSLVLTVVLYLLRR